MKQKIHILTLDLNLHTQTALIKNEWGQGGRRKHSKKIREKQNDPGFPSPVGKDSTCSTDAGGHKKFVNLGRARKHGVSGVAPAIREVDENGPAAAAAVVGVADARLGASGVAAADDHRFVVQQAAGGAVHRKWVIRQRIADEILHNDTVCSFFWFVTAFISQIKHKTPI
jgi:hypothetical protein